MIPCDEFLDALLDCGVEFFAGVPDSLLKSFCACVAARTLGGRHVIAANEGAAVAMAIGHHLATGTIPVVYLQNSGLGNLMNPLASLVDQQVYGIPMILIIGWRGELRGDGTQIHDEPQHVKQGRITLRQLRVLEVPFQVIDAQCRDYAEQIRVLYDLALIGSRPVALVVRKNTFADWYDSPGAVGEDGLLRREEAIEAIIESLPEDVPVVSTTGMASRELFELRRARNEGHARDFLTVGGMGYASHIALGVCMAKPHRRIACIDGDGAMLMHMGALAYCARADNLMHFVLNNGSHDSVGGQPTLARELDLAAIARSCGYKRVFKARSREELSQVLKQLSLGTGSAFVDVSCRPGHRSNLGRPDRTPGQNKCDFMESLRDLGEDVVRPR